MQFVAIMTWRHQCRPSLWMIADTRQTFSRNLRTSYPRHAMSASILVDSRLSRLILSISYDCLDHNFLVQWVNGSWRKTSVYQIPCQTQQRRIHTHNIIARPLLTSTVCVVFSTICKTSVYQKCVKRKMTKYNPIFEKSNVYLCVKRPLFFFTFYFTHLWFCVKSEVFHTISSFVWNAFLNFQ